MAHDEQHCAHHSVSRNTHQGIRHCRWQTDRDYMTGAAVRLELIADLMKRD